MRIQNLKNLTDSDLDTTVWRYLSVPKFMSMLTYQALWFSKLNILQDQFEGRIPRSTKEKMKLQNQVWKQVFNTPEFHRQIDDWPLRNEDDGRELTVVSCWFFGDSESKKMWDEYVGSHEGVAVKSSVRRLAQYVFVPPDPDMSQIGKVLYIDHGDYEFQYYEASQAHERAFLKDKRFSEEQEIRIVTMNFKTMCCVSKLGRPFTREECQGKNMNNFDNPGLNIIIDIRKLLTGVVIAPYAEEWFELLVRRIIELSDLSVPVMRSSIENA